MHKHTHTQYPDTHIHRTPSFHSDSPMHIQHPDICTQHSYFHSERYQKKTPSFQTHTHTHRTHNLPLTHILPFTHTYSQTHTTRPSMYTHTHTRTPSPVHTHIQACFLIHSQTTSVYMPPCSHTYPHSQTTPPYPPHPSHAAHTPHSAPHSTVVPRRTSTGSQRGCCGGHQCPPAPPHRAQVLGHTWPSRNCGGGGCCQGAGHIWDATAGIPHIPPCRGCPPGCSWQQVCSDNAGVEGRGEGGRTGNQAHGTPWPGGGY